MNESACMDRNTLMIEKATILERLQALERSGHKDEGATSLPELYRRYNEVIVSLSRLDAKPRYDPIAKLPSELFSTVLYEALAPSHPHSYKFSFKFEECILLTLVSAQWRNFILQTPLLWTCIDIGPEIQDLQARTQVCLALSRGLPLHLNLKVPHLGCDQVLPNLVIHRERIHGISLLWEIYAGHRPVPFSPRMISETIIPLFPLPNLRRLSTFPNASRGRDDLIRLFLEHCNSLEEISGASLERDMLPFDSVRQIRSASISLDLDSFLPMKRHMPNLDSIKLLAMPRLSSTNPPTSEVTESQRSLDSLKWQHLTCSYPQPENFALLIRRLQNLVTLELSGQIPLFFGVLAHLSELSRLDTLAMGLDIPEFKLETTPSFSFQANNRIRTLRLRFKNSNSSKSTFLQSTQINQSGLPDILIKCMPGLEELDLIMQSLPPLHKLYGEDSFPRLSKLYLQTDFGLLLDHPNELASSLRSVRFSCSPKLLSGLSSPNVSHLHLEMLRIPQKLEAIQTITYRNWPSLCSLTIFEEYFTGEPVHLPCLRELFLQVGPYPHVIRVRREHNTTKLCRALAIDPTMLPSLESLALEGTPHWDIFFLMVKRRNITTTEGIRPFKSLTITMRCPKELIRSLVDLLQGKFPNDVALYDLSINAVSEIVKDPSISGCEECLLSLRNCTVTLSKVNRIRAHQRKVTKLPELPPYPTLEEDILSTWEDRNKTWVRDIAPNISRVTACSNSKIDGFTTLTPDSYPDSLGGRPLLNYSERAMRHNSILY
ncbi:hypothetical protein CPB86DRAFT_734515 [Serendipita vermifera]|nr:hypothetical protein CPB86DRAFT_734515 [Serendipita vermifera]